MPEVFIVIGVVVVGYAVILGIKQIAGAMDASKEMKGKGKKLK